MTDCTRRAFVTAVGGALLAAPIALGLAGCTSDDKKEDDASDDSSSEIKLVNPGKLTIGCSPDYPPMEYRDGGKMAGFTYGLMVEVSDRLGLECNFLSDQNFDTLVTQVAAGTKMDCAVSSITINDERLEQIDFSDPYFDSNLAIVVMGDAPYADHAELNGEPVGAQSGSTGEEWVRENLRDSDYTPFDTTVELLQALRTGLIKAAVYDEPVARMHVASEYEDCKVLEAIATGEQYGIAINKQNPALTAAINQALADMREDGTLDELYDTWIASAVGMEAEEEPAEEEPAEGEADAEAADSAAGE